MSRSFLVTLAFCVLAAAGTAHAQADPFCTVGIYADADGTIGTYTPTQGQIFDVYIVMRAESLVNALAFELFVPGLNTDVFPAGESWGPEGGGLNIINSGGYNVGLGECAVGFNGNTIEIGRLSYVFPFETVGTRTLSLGPNLVEDPQAPVFSDCQGRIYPCNVTTGLFLEGPIDTESESFGAVKSLYAN